MMNTGGAPNRGNTVNIPVSNQNNMQSKRKTNSSYVQPTHSDNPRAYSEVNPNQQTVDQSYTKSPLIR